MAASAAYQEARRAHPKVKVPAETFERAWRARGKPPGRAIDLFLTEGIAAKDPAALDWLLETLEGLCRRLRGRYQPDHIAEAQSRTLHSLVERDDDGQPGIGKYGASGPLEGWLSVILSRQAYMVATAAQREPSVEEHPGSEGEVGALSVETRVLGERLQGHLPGALRGAALGLTSRERALLRLHYLEGVSLEELARSYQSHRATIARWVSAARARFLELTRAQLSEAGLLSVSDQSGLFELINANLEVSMRVLLQTRAPGAEDARGAPRPRSR